MMLKKITIIMGITIGLNVLLVGCALYPIDVDLASSQLMNPDKSQHALAVQVKIFLLRDEMEYSRATFNELWHHAKKTLKDSLVMEKVTILIPGEKRNMRINSKYEVNYISAMGVFRKPTLQNWRSIKKVSNKFPLIKKSFVIKLKNNKIDII